MKQTLWALAAGIGTLLAGRDDSGLRADVVPSPVFSLRALPSTGCAMAELSRAVARRSQAVLSCIHDASNGILLVSCSFNAEGGVVKCEAQPGRASDYSKREVSCTEKALASLHLDPKTSDPTKCAAQVEVRLKARPYHRPHRPSNDPNDPLNGL